MATTNKPTALGGEDFFSAYFRYAGAGINECPSIYHRWGGLSIIGTLLGRRYSFPFGHGQIYPNQYINIMGAPGTRKSTAIKIAKKLLQGAGFSRFAPDKVSKEKFLLLFNPVETELDLDDLLDLTLEEPAELCITAEEFTDFLGANNMDFITLLTTLWDNLPFYENPKIHGESARVVEPTVNILAGNTVQNFALAFPPEAIGNGFLSRVLLIHGETTGRKVTFPPKPDELLVASLIDHLKLMKRTIKGEATISKEAYGIFDRVYKEFVDLDDSRFLHYSSRRLTHIIKLCLILSAADLRTEISATDVLRANTILHYAELRMPRALGEYGKSKFADQANSVLDLLCKAHAPLSMTQIWAKLSRDFTKVSELGEILRNLEHAGRIQQINKPTLKGFVPRRVDTSSWASDLILTDYMTEEEMSL